MAKRHHIERASAAVRRMPAYEARVEPGGCWIESLFRRLDAAVDQHKKAQRVYLTAADMALYETHREISDLAAAFDDQTTLTAAPFTSDDRSAER